MVELDPDLQPIFGKYNTNNRDINTIERITLAVQELRNLQKTVSKEILTQKKTIITIQNLTTTIENLDKKNGKLQDKLYLLTFATVGLAIIQTIFGALQIYFYVHPFK